MIRIDQQETFNEVPGVVVWRDSDLYYRYYVLPTVPRFRLQDGNPVFKFIKYRLPVDRDDGKKGGGFVFFDTEIAVADDKMKALTTLLQERTDKIHKDRGGQGSAPKVEYGTMTYTRGSVRLLLEENGVLIEKVRGAGKPSLYGNNVACFAIELTPEGATVLEAAMQGAGASAVSVVYDLYFSVKLPPIRAVVDFNASKYYDYCKTVDQEVSMWTEDHYTETMHELLIQSESSVMELQADFNLPDPAADKALKDKLRDWMTQTLDNALVRQSQEAAAHAAGLNKIDSQKLMDKTMEDLGGDDLDNFQQAITQQSFVSFHYEYRENVVAEWNLAPQGTLPTLTSLKGKDGQPIKWSDYALLIDANDPFFQQLNVNVQVNADFEQLPLYSVELHIEYPKPNNKKEIAEYGFKTTNDAYRFSTFIDNDNYEYQYWYEVNFKGQARTFKSKPTKTDERLLTVNLDETGILNLDVIAGDIDFDQVRLAQVDVRYPAVGQVLAQQKFTMDKDHTAHRLQKVIFAAIDQPYQYTVKYVMADGKEIVTPPIIDTTKPLVVNDPFSEIRSVTVRASGDLSAKVQVVFVDLTYNDERNKYKLTKSLALDSNTPADEWLIPVIAGSEGIITYTGLIRYFDGTEEPIAEKTADRATILVGPSVQEIAEITILPDLMFDNPDVRLVRISLAHGTNGDRARKDFTFRPGDTDPGIWTLELKDKKQSDIHWEATFFLNGSQRKITADTSDLTIVPELPAE